ncbi:MAG: carbohydrate ABC transporter permease, partial [Lachnospiraceae bacterium]|nr:carbohydrate ABC transporter permease [Lachnospiraceae bacterium]
MKKKISAVDIILVLVFVIVIIITLYPFLNVLAISFNDATDTIKNINFIIPRMFTLSNYKYVFKDSDFLMPFVTSVSRTVVGTLVGVVTTSMLAYTLSRKDFVLH